MHPLVKETVHVGSSAYRLGKKFLKSSSYYIEYSQLETQTKMFSTPINLKFYLLQVSTHSGDPGNVPTSMYIVYCIGIFSYIYIYTNTYY